MYVVLEGCLDVRIRERRALEDVPVGRLGPGELVGEMGWLLGTRRSASVVAMERCALLEVPAACLEVLRGREHPELPRVAALSWISDTGAADGSCLRRPCRTR
jgi:CRP-like cAMP-binding protein